MKRGLGQKFSTFLFSIDENKLHRWAEDFKIEQPVLRTYIADNSVYWKNGFLFLYSFLKESMGLTGEQINEVALTRFSGTYETLGTKAIIDRLIERDGDLLLQLIQISSEEETDEDAQGEIDEVVLGAVFCWWVFRGPKTG